MTKQSKAITALQQKAKKNNVDAMFELYTRYSKAQDVDLDKKKANDYFIDCLTYLTATDSHEQPLNKISLDQLQLVDFRKFSAFEVNFEKDLTVFIGGNGAGKTSIADAIAKTFSWINARIETNGKLSKPLTETDINVNSQHYAQVSSTISLGATRYEGVLAKSVKGAENEKTSELDSLRHLSNLYRVINDQQRKQHRAEAKTEINIPLFAYYSVERSHAKSNQTFDLEKLQDVETNSRFDALDSSALGGSGNFEKCLEWFVTLDNLINSVPSNHKSDVKSEELKSEITALEAIVKTEDHPLWKMLEEKKAQYQASQNKQTNKRKDLYTKLHQAIKNTIIAIVPSVSALFVDRSRSGRAELKINNDGSEINVFQTSQGQRILISMVADLARRLVLLNPRLENPMQGQGVVIIDEIELHLHPKWQQGIIQSLQQTFTNIQFIVTTHSPQVLSTVDKRCIRQFTVDESGKDIVTIPAFQTKGVASADILERIMSTQSTPQIPQAQWINQFATLLQDGNKADADILLEKLQSHFTGDKGVAHPVIDNCRNQIKIFEMKARMRQVKDRS